MGKFSCPLPIVRNNFYTWEHSYLRTNKKPPIIFVGTGDTPKAFPKEDFLDVVAAHEYSHYLLGHKDYHGDAEADVRQKESDCWFHTLLKAEEWHVNPLIAQWLIAHVERTCDWGGFSLSIIGKSAYILPDASMTFSSDTRIISDICRAWRLWLHGIADSLPLRIAKAIAIRLWQEFEPQARALLRHRAVRCIWFLSTNLSRAKPLVIFCVAIVCTTLKSLRISCLIGHIMSAAVKMFRWLQMHLPQFSASVAAGFVKLLSVMRLLRRSMPVARCLLSPDGFRSRMTEPILWWCRLACTTIRQGVTTIPNRFHLLSLVTNRLLSHWSHSGLGIYCPLSMYGVFSVVRRARKKLRAFVLPNPADACDELRRR